MMKHTSYVVAKEPSAQLTQHTSILQECHNVVILQ